jgi:hypothetical protein
VSYPTVNGRAVEGVPYREAQVCLGTAFANSTYKFFLSGTSTPANVYQNGALTTSFPITGLVSSDSYGRFPPIYLDPSVVYRVQLFNAANVLQRQTDPYTSQLSTVGTSSLSAYGVRIASTGEVTIPAPNSGGSGIALTLKCGALGTAALQLAGTIAGNSALIINSSATTGSQTATFTATNKPGTATSAPAGWLPITCDGVQYYTPIWHGNAFSPYVSNPSAAGEVIVASSVLFGGNGITTATNGTATPGNWFVPTSGGIGTSYYINITKTSGLSGLAFSAAQGSWTNIGTGLTISSNAQAAIGGTYQLSSSVSGSPVVASGTISLSNNNGVQSPTYNGATPLVLVGDGTAIVNGVGTSNWYAPTTTSIGNSFYVSVTQTGGTGSFTGLSGVTLIGGSETIGVTGSGGTFSASGTYSLSSDAAGLVVLGSGTITLTGSNVQSPNYSGTTPLNLAGNGAATLNGAGTSSWYSPNSSNVGAGFWINITRTSGTSGVNFTAAQGSWTNITNGGLTIDLSGYTGDVGTVSASGTYQISNSSSGTPVLGSGTISLSISGLTVTRTYSTAVSGATETVPTGATNMTVNVWGGGGSGGTGSGQFLQGGGGGGGGYVVSTSVSVTGGQTFTYTVGAGGTAGINPNNGNAGAASTVSGTGVSINAGGGQGGIKQSSGAAGGAGGTASGGNTTNTAGLAGTAGAGGGGAGGNSGAGNSGVPGGGSSGVTGAGTGNSSPGSVGQVQFVYT